MKAHWRKISNLGISPDLDSSLKKKIVVSNQLCTTVALITIPYIFIFTLAGIPLFGAMVIFVVLGYGLVPILHKNGYTRFTRLLPVLTGSTAVTAYSVALGQTAGIHYYYLALFCFPFVLFTLKEKSYMMIGLLLPVTLNALLYLGGFELGPWEILEPQTLNFIKLAIVSSTALTIIAALLYLYISNEKTESQLHKTIEGLEAAKSAAEMANQAKSYFLATMNHEIRTPLGVILGYSQLLSNPGRSPENIAKAIDAIHRNSEHLLSLIDDILDLSKVEAGLMQIHPSPTNIEKEVNSVVEFLQPNADKKHIKIEVTTKAQLPEVVHTDPVRFRQVLFNILGNAIKYTDGGKIDVSIDLEVDPDEAGSSYLVIDVEDMGIGISEEEQKILFKPFTQVKPLLKGGRSGTGLGLYLSQKLAQALGGDVSILWSKVNHGSCFRITIDPGSQLSRLLKSEANSAEAHESKPEENEGALKGLKILLVEDSPDNQELIKAMLEFGGAELTIANNGKEGVTKAQSDDFHLVLMDVQMPVMDGYEATKRLKSAGYTKPIIALTAYSMQEEKQNCLQAGCDDYLSKPVRLADLIKTVKKWV